MVPHFGISAEMWNHPCCLLKVDVNNMNGIEVLLQLKDLTEQTYSVWKNAILHQSEEAEKEIERLFERNIEKFKNSSYQRNGFRARIVYDDSLNELVLGNRDDLFEGRSGVNGFPADKMGAPPIEKTGAGRANKEKESFLYLASDIQTACAEVQPLCESMISVIEFQVKEGLTIIDFRAIPDDLRSFTDKDDTEKLIDIVFCRSLLHMFSMPVRAREQQLYSYSQHIAKKLKERGIDGIIYNSSHNDIDDAYNLVIFDPANANCIQEYGELYICLSKKASFQNVSVNYRNNNLKIVEAERTTEPYLWNRTLLLSQELKKHRRTEQEVSEDAEREKNVT